MKKVAWTTLAVLVPALIHAQTQGEMNHTSLIDFQKSDAKLNVV